ERVEHVVAGSHDRLALELREGARVGRGVAAPGVGAERLGGREAVGARASLAAGDRDRGLVLAVVVGRALDPGALGLEAGGRRAAAAARRFPADAHPTITSARTAARASRARPGR